MSNTPNSYYSDSAIRKYFQSLLDEQWQKGILTLGERSWLNRALFESEAERARRPDPLYVCEVFFYRGGDQVRKGYFRGAFTLSKSLEDAETYRLFSLVNGLETFPSWQALTEAYRQYLSDAKHPVLYFLPMDARPGLLGTGTFGSAKRRIQGPVFNTTSALFELQKKTDQQNMLDILSGLPTIHTVILETLEGLAKASHHANGEKTPGSVVCSGADLAIEFFLKGRLSAQSSYGFTHAPDRTGSNTQTREERQLKFMGTVSRVSNTLETGLSTALTQHWTVSTLPGLTVESCVEQFMGDRLMDALMQARHSEKLTIAECDALYKCATGATSPHVNLATLSLAGPEGEPVRLVGWYDFFVKHPTHTLWVMGDTGFIPYKDWLDFAQQTLPRFNALRMNTVSFAPPLPDSSLSRCLSFKDRGRLTADVQLKLEAGSPGGDLFAVLASSVLTRATDDVKGLVPFLKQSATEVQSYSAADYASFTRAVLDHACDVRHVVNPVLLDDTLTHRWSTRFSFGETTLETPAETLEQLRVPLSSIRARLEALRDDINALLNSFPTLSACVNALFSEDWALTGLGRLDCEHLRLTVHASTQGPNTTARSSRPLIEAFLESLTGFAPLPDDKTLITFERVTDVGINAPLNAVERAALHQLLANFRQCFSAKLGTFLDTFFYTRRPDDDIFTKAERLAIFKSTLLWAGGYYFFCYQDQFRLREASCLACVQTRRKRAERTSYFYFVPDVYSVVLYSNKNGLNVNIENCFLITERGGLESACAGHVIFWSPAKKFEVFKTLDACQAELGDRIRDKTASMSLLNNVSETDSDMVRALQPALAESKDTLFSFLLIEDDYTDTLTRSFIDQQVRETSTTLHEAIAAKLPAEALENHVRNYVERFRESLDVSSIIQHVDTLLFKQALPKLLGAATDAEQADYVHILERYRDVVRNDRDYLYEIPEIEAYTFNALKVQLAQDYPGQSLNPDDISITLTQVLSPGWSAEIASMGAAVSHDTQSLSAFTLAGFSQLNGHLSARSQGPVPLPDTFNGDYIKKLVRTLNIGGQYSALLEQKLHASGPERLNRLGLFCRQLPLHALETAFRAKLQNTLSDKAYCFIKQVLEMPDGLARERLDGTPIIIRQLQLLASADSEPDLVKGVYLIGPDTLTGGPIILWTLYAQDFTFKEYADQAAFIADLLSRGSLQQLVLQRVDPLSRRKYDHGGFKEPHIIYIGVDFFSFDIYSPPSPVTISNTPVNGNVLLHLYEDNYNLLIDMAAQQSLSTAQADWQTFKGLMSLSAQAVLGLATPFLPAALNIPLFVSQTLDLLKAGVHAVSKRQWGEAIEEFVTAFMLMVPELHRQQANRSRFVPPSPADSHASVSPDPHAGPDIHLEAKEWAQRGATLRSQRLSVLDAYTEQSVSLQALDYDASTHLYHSKTGDLSYIVMTGKVFRVKQSANRWRIHIGEDRDGPAVQLNALQQWELDPWEPLLGGGPAHSRHAQGRRVHDFTVEARGIKSIRRLAPEKAVMIQMAHQMALDYLSHAKQTLNGIMTMDPQALQYRLWLADYLSMPTVTDRELLIIDHAINMIFARLSKPSMNPLNSERYLKVKALIPDDDVVAFIDEADTHKYVYLTDLFFQTPFDRLNVNEHEWLEPTLPPFDYNRHYRAVTLLHELSHQKALTEDIEYMNVTYPFVELLKDNPNFKAFSKSRLSALQRDTLSITTSKIQLFNPVNNQRSLPAPAAERILAITQTSTLDDARDVFLSDPQKRASIILSNADSIALIISRLGGKLETYLPVHPPAP